MKTHIYLIALLLSAGLLSTGCGKHNHTEHTHVPGEACGESHDQSPEMQDSEDDHDHTGIILLSDAQGKELGVAYEKAISGPFASIIRTGGAIEAAPGDRSTIVATTSGIVSFTGRELAEGTFVNKDVPFIILSSENMVAGNFPQQLADARAELAKAEADYERAESLSGNKVVTASEMAALKLTLETTQRKVAILSKNVTKDAKGIVSPQSGYITTLHVNEGSYVEAGQPLAVVSANRNLVLRGDLPQRCGTEITTIKSARFTTPYDNRNYDLSDLNGRLLGSGRALSTDSPTLPIRFQFENKNGLVTGSVVEVFLQGSPHENVLTIPLSALTEEQGAYFVYVRTMPEHFVKRAVEAGMTDGDRIEVKSGLHEGEEVVSKGAFYVRLASMSSEIPHGHTH